MSTKFAETREVIERIKDIISSDVKGCVFDYHVADVLEMRYSTLRIAVSKNKMPLAEIVIFCHKKDLLINDLLFT